MSSTQRPKVLIIDDERGPRESLRILLKNEFEVVLTDSVPAGIEALKAGRPDVIVSDIRMPGANGIDGLRLIRSLDQDTSVIMLTGYGDLATAREAIRLGANDYLGKPFDADDMLRLVRENVAHTLARRRKTAALADLERLNSELQDQLANSRRMAVLGLSSSQMVHDISNPLTLVIGYLDLLQMTIGQIAGGAMPADARKYLDSIEGNLRHCTDVLQTWRSLGNKGAMKKAAFRIADLVNAIVSDMAVAPPESTLTVEISPDSSTAMVMADRTHLRRALQNILHNALQAVSPETGRVAIRCGKDGSDVRIDVVDNGCGIAPENIRRIFEPFFTTRKQTGGTGLGLFISKQIVEDHDGRLDIESRLGEGTRMSIFLPLAS